MRTRWKCGDCGVTFGEEEILDKHQGGFCLGGPVKIKPAVARPGAPPTDVLIWLQSEQVWLAEMSWGLHEAIDKEDLKSVGSIAHQIARRMLTVTGELYWIQEELTPRRKD